MKHKRRQLNTLWMSNYHTSFTVPDDNYSKDQDKTEILRTCQPNEQCDTGNHMSYFNWTKTDINLLTSRALPFLLKGICRWREHTSRHPFTLEKADLTGYKESCQVHQTKKYKRVLASWLQNNIVYIILNLQLIYSFTFTWLHSYTEAEWPDCTHDHMFCQMKEMRKQ